jgi:hypothetical protein
VAVFDRGAIVKIAVLILAATLSGCAEYDVSNAAIAFAQKFCADHGGLHGLSNNSASGLTTKCADGTEATFSRWVK